MLAASISYAVPADVLLATVRDARKSDPYAPDLALQEREILTFLASKK
jgi:hypothetical protein